MQRQLSCSGEATKTHRYQFPTDCNARKSSECCMGELKVELKAFHAADTFATTHTRQFVLLTHSFDWNIALKMKNKRFTFLHFLWFFSSTEGSLTLSHFMTPFYQIDQIFLLTTKQAGNTLRYNITSPIWILYEPDDQKRPPENEALVPFDHPKSSISVASK